ncbi:restriction endonuclease subunit S [Thermomonas sp.]|uniref:restriction endonuclease subunit S n=1 Tax=Thermomonas sp. TaxID=1971895 RepID=UPI002CF019A8|nr:restriction endonuclease subunit S [Thermomonas sp.]HRO62340.1 restriction endonuclease subunit S [Thermomonas sp.]
MSMAKQRAKTAGPALRFPEFRDASDWNRVPLGRLFSERTESGFIDLPLLSLMDKEGLVPQEESNRKDNSNADKSKYLRVVPGDIAYNTMRMWEGRSAHVGIEGLISPAYTVCAPVGETNGRFFSYYFKTGLLIGQFRKYSQGLVKDTLNLKYESFQRIEIAYPPDRHEQQKIADCLTSLDEVIAAQGRKVEALKAHKRGLMQQLFPREGETRPRLRFPEFRDAPEWMQQRIEAFARDGLTNGIFNDTKRQSSSYRLINVSEMYLPTPICESDLAFAHAGDEDIKKKFAHNGDIFFTRSSLVREGIAYSNIYLGVEKRVTFDGHLIRLRPKLDVVVPIFLHYALKSDVVRSQFIAKSKSATMTTIGQRDVGETGLAIPQLEEQQRIADCLTSLDTRIAAETQQLAALKTHKQGLMQQLFPAPEATA